jgi:hypothetical protein
MEEFIEGNKKIRYAVIAYYCFWMILIIVGYQYGNHRISEINQINDFTDRVEAMRSLFLWTLVIPCYLFFGIKALIFSLLGFLIIKQRKYPPAEFPMPWKIKVVTGAKAYLYGFSCYFTVIISLSFMAMITYSYYLLFNNFFNTL